MLIDSSKNYSPEDAIKILFDNFIKSVVDAQAIIALDSDNQDRVIASQMSELDNEETFQLVSGSIRTVLDRLAKELVTSSGPVSFFDTDHNRLIFIKIKGVILSVAMKIDGSVDAALPYAYLTAEKIGNIMEGRDVELDIPLIKVITDEEEQKNLRNHYFELRSSSGNFSFKIIVLGDQNVGKTSLILRHAENKFKESYLPTLGVSITTNTIDLSLRKAKTLFSIWDFGGQSYFRRVRLSYYAGAQACFIVFDLTNRESFENVLKWNEEKLKFAGDIVTILLGNKNDLPERAVSNEEVVEFANKNGFTFFETSALTGSNVTDAFSLLAYKLVDKEAKKVEDNEINTLKDELKTAIDDNGGKLSFGLIRNKALFDPVIQAFLEMDHAPDLQSTPITKTYSFASGLTLVSTEITNEEDFDTQLEMLKNLNGLFGVIDARHSSDENIAKVSQFLKLIFQSATNERFMGSIGLLCEREKYSENLAKIDLTSVLSGKNVKKSVFFYNLSDNYLLEIVDNLHMFFQAMELGSVESDFEV